MACRTYTTLQERFWKRVDRNGPVPANRPELGPCWIWTGYADQYGRGQLYVGNGKICRTHLISWELANGPIPEGKCLLHDCDNMGCLNPRHMHLGTQLENIAEMAARGRANPRGMFWPGFPRPKPSNKPAPTLEERFWAKVNKNGPVPPHCQELGNCWVWMASTNQCGYGTFGIGGSGHSIAAHKAHWKIIAKRELPAGMELLHKCDNPSCVRLEHLQIGTHAENMADCAIKGRSFVPSGTKHYKRQMTLEDALEIRRLHAEGAFVADLMRRFGKSRSTVSKIINNRLWVTNG